MAISDVINRVFREFRRYTGDGLPGEPANAPLPIGDPQSGVHNPKKSEIRAAFGEYGDAVEGAADRAEEYAALLGSAVLSYRTVAALLADSLMTYSPGPGSVTVAAGDVVTGEGFRYRVAASGTTAYNAGTTPDGYHLLTAGGVKLFVLPSGDGSYNANAFNVKGDGTSDDTAALRLAIEFAGAAGLSLGKAGTIRVTSSIQRFGDLRIKNPNGTKIYGDTGTYSSQAVIKVTGSLTQVQDLSVNVSRGGVTLTGAGTWPFAIGDIGLIYNPADGSFVNISGRGYYRSGEFFECMDTPTTAMKLRNPLYAAYLAASVDVYKITPVLVEIDDIAMEGSASTLNLLHIELGKDVVINRPRMKHVYDAGIVMDQCFGFTITAPMINNKGAGNPGDYGIVVANCQKWTISAADIYSRRHPITTGGYDKVGCVPVRAGKIIGGTLRNDQASGATCGDFHGNTEDCEYIAVTFYGGASFGGKNNGYRGCIIRGGVNSGPAFLASEVVGGVFNLLDNLLELYTDPEPNGRGFVDIGGNSVVLDSTVAEDVTIRIRGNTFKSAALSANTNLIYGGNVGTSKKINIEIADNFFDVNNFSSVLRLYRSSGTAASDFLIVDENICALSGKYSIFPDGDYSVLNVLRCQATRWSESVTTSTGASFKAGTNTNFKWRFPRPPTIIAGRTGIGYIGDKLGVPYVATLDFAGATLAIGTDGGANFSSASAVTLTGEAAIRQV